MPADANVHGDVFGGWIMAQVDMAGALPALAAALLPQAPHAGNSVRVKPPGVGGAGGSV